MAILALKPSAIVRPAAILELFVSPVVCRPNTETGSRIRRISLIGSREPLSFQEASPTLLLLTGLSLLQSAGAFKDGRTKVFEAEAVYHYGSSVDSPGIGPVCSGSLQKCSCLNYCLVVFCIKLCVDFFLTRSAQLWVGGLSRSRRCVYRPIYRMDGGESLGLFLRFIPIPRFASIYHRRSGFGADRICTVMPAPVGVADLAARSGNSMMGDVQAYEASIFAMIIWAVMLATGCASTDYPKCQRKLLTKKQLILIVENEIRRQGGNPSPERRSRIKIKRDGCDYLYHEIIMPRKPGEFIFVRINERGEILDFLHGL
jgi:hypothetical protein